MQSLADDAVSIDGVDYLPVGKPNSYKDYELIYYINDVTIENEQVLVEYGANGTATGTYEYGLQRLSVEHVNEAKEYYLYNGTGNVVQTTAQNGSTFLRYTYDAFGNISSIRAPMTVDIDDLNRYTYNGEDYDYNTGLQYLRARYYDTSVGSFISQDTYAGTIVVPITQNRYTYAGNSPTIFCDPSGHFWHIVASAVVGAVVGAASGVISEVVSAAVEKRPIDWKEAGKNALSGAASGLTSGAVLAATGSPTLAGAAGGAVGGAVGAAVNGGDLTDIALAAGTGLVTGAVSGAVGGALGQAGKFVTNKIAGTISNEITNKVVNKVGTFVGTMIGGTATSVVGGIISRSIDGNPETKAFSGTDILKDTLTGIGSSFVGCGVGTIAAKIPGVGNALQKVQDKVDNGIEAKVVNSLMQKAWVTGQNLFSRSSVRVDSYKNMKGVNGQRHHLNQDAAFKGVIDYDDGLCVELNGNAISDIDSPHYNAHKFMEGFWSKYRAGGEKYGTMPTCEEYNNALAGSMRAAGFNRYNSNCIVKQAAAQQVQHGLSPNDYVPRIPGKLNQAKG